MAKRKNSNADKVFVVLHYLMDKSKQANRPDFTNKKAQKMLYYAQAWSLVLNDKKLFDEKFEAWVHGAVIYKVYKKYSDLDFDPITDEYNQDEFKILNDEEKELLDEVWDVYGKFDADYLERLNHQEAPWQQARSKISSYDPSKAIITEESMKKYYKTKLIDAT